MIQKTRFHFKHYKLKMFAAVSGEGTAESVDHVRLDILARAISR